MGKLLDLESHFAYPQDSGLSSLFFKKSQSFLGSSNSKFEIGTSEILCNSGFFAISRKTIIIIRLAYLIAVLDVESSANCASNEFVPGNERVVLHPHENRSMNLKKLWWGNEK